MRAIFKKDSESKLTLLISILVMVILRLFIADPGNTLTWDVFGYYLYLPAYFIYDDPTLQQMDWVNHIIEVYHSTGTLYQAVQVESGNWVMRYPGGLAFLNLPFFLAADALAEPLGFARDGFSLPYQFGWIAGSLFYSILGLIYSRKLLRNYFSDGWSAGLLLILVFATNYLEMTTYGGPLAHSFLFALYAIGLWMIDGWGDRISPGQMLKVGILTGIITMCRPNEGLFILIPVLWKLTPVGKAAYGAFLTRHIPALVAGGIGLLLGGLPQMLYWKFSSGHWFFYSYQDNGVGFDLFSPHTMDFLFSFRKGWLIYTPVMMLAILGFVRMYRVNRTLFIPFFFFFLLNLYVVSSWSVWWYGGGSYSSRSMVSSYLMLLFPIGYLLTWLKEKKGIIWNMTLIIIGGLMVLNLFQFWQFKTKMIDGERMTAAYYWKIFGKTTVPEGAKDLLLVERQAEAHETMPADTSRLIGTVLFDSELGKAKEQENRVRIQFDTMTSIPVLQLDPEHPYTRAFETAYRDITEKEYAWLRIEAEVYVPDSAEAPMLVTHFLFKDKPYKYTTTEYLIPSIPKESWQTIRMDYMTPEVRNEKDRVKIYLWSRSGVPVFARRLRIIRYEPK